MTHFVPAIDQHAAIDWISESLAQGAVGRKLLTTYNMSFSNVLVLDAAVSCTDFRRGGMIGTDKASHALDAFLRNRNPAPEYVLVEDELALPRDKRRPPSPIVSFFVDQTVLRGVPRPYVSAGLIRKLSHGYPRNMFVLNDEPGIVKETHLSTLPVELISAVETVIVGAHDDEGYVIADLYRSSLSA